MVACMVQLDMDVSPITIAVIIDAAISVVLALNQLYHMQHRLNLNIAYITIQQPTIHYTFHLYLEPSHCRYHVYMEINLSIYFNKSTNKYIYKVKPLKLNNKTNCLNKYLPTCYR